jgi:hypothetical protein
MMRILNLKEMMENLYETPQMEVMSLELDSAILTVSDNTVIGPDPEYPD